MPNYTPAPSQMFGNIEQNGQTGMLGGYLQSIANEFSMKNQQNALRDSDQDFLEKMRKYEMDKNDDAVKRADNVNKLKGAQDLGAQYDEGIPQAAARDAAATQISTNQGKRDEQAQKRLHMAGEFLSDVDQEIGDRQLDPLNHNDMELWRKARERGASIGVVLDPSPTPEAVDTVRRQSKAYYNSAAFRQKSALEDKKLKGEADIHAADRASAERVANTQADAQRYRADHQKSGSMPDPKRVAVSEIMDRVQKTGVATEADIGTVMASESAAIQNMWAVQGKDWKEMNYQSMKAKGKEAFAKFKADNIIPLDATEEQAAGIMADRKYQEAAREHALRLLGNPKVSDAGSGRGAANPPLVTDRGTSAAPAAPSRSASGKIGGQSAPNAANISAMKAKYPDASDAQIEKSLKASKLWIN